MSFFDALLTLLVAATIQNIVLTTGLGTSMLLRMMRRPGELWWFTALLCFFAVTTVLVMNPADRLLGIGWTAKIVRPAVVVAITAVLYVALTLILKKWLPRLYERLSRLMPLAAFNNLVVAVTMIINHQFAVKLLPAIGLSLGACLSFTLLTVLTAAGIDRADNSDVPQAFRGIPVALLYLGLLSLALMGFKASLVL